MAEEHSKSQAHSCKENVNEKKSTTEHFPQKQAQKIHKSRQLTILKAVRESRLKPKSHLHYHEVQLEPYTILRGPWLEKAGFSIGQKITVQVRYQQLIITPTEGHSS